MNAPRLYKIFTTPLLQWFDKYGRKDFPWQNPRSAYRVFVSEIMLQQTQTKTVIPYFNRFITRFEDIASLALACEDEVLSYWSGLGYYSRARNLHKTANIIYRDYGGTFPSNLEQLIKLPGIGPSTAAAIASLAFGKPTAILDANVKRVLCRYFLIEGSLQQRDTQQKLWQLANECMSPHRAADYTQAIMDLGATCCTTKNPHCAQCPLQSNCLAKQYNRVEELPYKAEKKMRPTVNLQFLLLHQEGRIFLEKRPSRGIWGGLWCTPTIEKDCCPKAHVANTYQLGVHSIQTLMEFKHSFSHFHMHISALSLEINRGLLANFHLENGNWFHEKDLQTLGLAKPVSAITEYFFNGQGQQ